MLRAAFWLTALLFLPVGLSFYLFSEEVAYSLGIYPLWLVRVSGGLILGWGVNQAAAGFSPNRSKIAGLVTGNLLVIATLVPVLLKQVSLFSAGLSKSLWAIVVILGLSAVLALISFPSRISPKIEAKIET